MNGEETLGSPAPPVQTAAALPDLASAPYWLAGVPPGHGAGPARAAPPPLLGCVGSVTVDRSGYDLLDAPAKHGLEPRCGEKVSRTNCNLIIFYILIFSYIRFLSLFSNEPVSASPGSDTLTTTL